MVPERSNALLFALNGLYRNGGGNNKIRAVIDFQFCS